MGIVAPSYMHMKKDSGDAKQSECPELVRPTQTLAGPTCKRPEPPSCAESIVRTSRLPWQRVSRDDACIHLEKYYLTIGKVYKIFFPVKLASD